MQISLSGLFVALALALPELLTLFFPPKPAPAPDASTPAYTPPPNVLLTVCERLGQAGLLTWLVAGTSNLALLFLTRRLWFAAMCVFVALYWFAWYVWFSHGRDAASLYAPLWKIPLPLTVFSLLAYGFASVWAKSLFMGVCWLLFAAGSVYSALRGKKLSAASNDSESAV